jgi:hypothetical protein
MDHYFMGVRINGAGNSNISKAGKAITCVSIRLGKDP